MTRILVIEDDPADVLEYYARPFARFLTESQTGRSLSMEIALLGDHKESQLKTLRGELDSHRFVVLTHKPYWNDDRDRFQEELADRLLGFAVVMVDRSVFGSRWQGQNDRVIYDWVKQHVPSHASVLLVANLALKGAVEALEETWDQITFQTLPKGPGPRYYLRFQRRLEENLRESWIAQLNTEKKNVGGFIDRLANGTGPQEDDVAEAARLALVALLVPRAGGPRHLSAAVHHKKRTFFDPLRNAVAQFQRQFDGAEHRALTRRRVLFGLQQVWREFSGRASNGAEQRIWVEVIAGGYHSYHLEREAMKRIVSGLRDGTLVTSRIPRRLHAAAVKRFTVDLRAIGADYLSTGGRGAFVTEAIVVARKGTVRRDTSGRVRYFQGVVLFKRSQDYRKSATDKMKVFARTASAAAPADGSPDTEWRDYWKSDQIEWSRDGHTEVVAKSFQGELFFKDQESAFTITPTPNELEWWSRSRATVARIVQDQVAQFGGDLYWRARNQSEERFSVLRALSDEDED